MDRIIYRTPFAAPVTFYEDGAVVDPGTVTVTVTREDGTVLETDQPTSGSGAAARTFLLAAATHAASLDVLRLDWTSASKGTLTTFVEIVGGNLVTLAQLRAVSPLSNEDTYPDAALIAARTQAESALEDACGVAFVPRYFREKVDGTGTTDVLLPARPLEITSATVDGTALTQDELDALELYPSGVLYREAGWTCGRRNVEIKGSKGYDRLPPYVMQGARALAKSILVDLPADDRATSLTSDGGTTQLLKDDGTFGIPAADRVIALYGLNHGVG